MVRFFIPMTRDHEHSESVFQFTYPYLVGLLGDLEKSRYQWVQSEKGYRAEVGGVEPNSGEIVAIIVRSAEEHGSYYVCTPSFGLSQGEPVLVDGDSIGLAFDPSH